MERDSNFAGISGDGLPTVTYDFSCKSGDSITHPEVVVDIKQDVSPVDFEARGTTEEGTATEEEQWIRFPVTEVVEWINKDGPSDMTRTAKVKFPYEWGDHPVIQYINGFNSQNNITDQNDPYDEARIFYYDHDLEEWVISHYGYVGGVGPANDNQGVGKFWVYDPADLMKGIQVSKGWNEPSIANVLEFALRGEDNRGRPVGIEKRSIFEPPIKMNMIGQADIPAQKQRDIRDKDPEGFTVKVGPFKTDLNGLFADAFDYVAETLIDPVLNDNKRFQSNRNNMVDMMDWFTNLIDARWWFEPTADGPVLTVDATAYKEGSDEGKMERRYFVDEAVTDEWQALRRDNGKDGTYFTSANTLNNSALADIKPFNTLLLFGESKTLRERYPLQFGSSSAPAAMTETYPWVRVQYGPLLDRAGGYEYSSTPIESDTVYIEQAEKHARGEFRKHIAEQTEGSMELRGEPHMMPFDYIVTVPTCNDTYRNANAEPITWEVNGVKHIRRAGEQYTTELGVSVAVMDEQITVESEYRKS